MLACTNQSVCTCYSSVLFAGNFNAFVQPKVSLTVDVPTDTIATRKLTSQCFLAIFLLVSSAKS